MIMDMSSATESARWYDNPRLSGSPNAGTSHQSAGSTGTASANNGGIVDASDMGAFYSLENAGHRRPYYSTGYAPHGILRSFSSIQPLFVIASFPMQFSFFSNFSITHLEFQFFFVNHFKQFSIIVVQKLEY